MWQEATEKFLSESLVPFLPKLASGIGLFLLFWLGGKISRKMLSRLGALRKLEESLISFLCRSVNAIFLILGVVMAMSAIGVDVSALVAGLGLTGFAIGFALKDIISNTLSGVLLIIYKPFSVGDVIKVSSFEGKVIDVDLRYTLLEGEEENIYVPNSLLFNNAVRVHTKAA